MNKKRLSIIHFVWHLTYSDTHDFIDLTSGYSSMQAYIKRLKRKMTLQYQMTARQFLAAIHLKRKLEFVFCAYLVFPPRFVEVACVIICLLCLQNTTGQRTIPGYPKK